MTSEIDNTDDLIQQKILSAKKERKIKIIRIITVIAYLIAVSTASVMLSAYYMFLWKPQVRNLTLPSDTEEGIMMAQHSDVNHYTDSATSMNIKNPITAVSSRIINTFSQVKNINDVPEIIVSPSTDLSSSHTYQIISSINELTSTSHWESATDITESPL
ncbi:uncharacterized protein LOC126899066 isoform X1 [Daktulosphaira vitifoliae]|uniref:uncharacterized protein LOC126899066 isoform X1 n=1 Tax=Daktulosphaira vitifoliae TaxID=58002 RepID=UPI0021A9FC98|nr:uncharacterized protein LOC126899066 isoform X1 [Daktulosphaira vitifoliae]XP_050529557.1 uncharacterized protein LOC126899066 isoform X1 [Daktulosphaira vitifoliae]XP_050529558.1 uncharacterized protein LOC126899066 isoform X1 [Daktulosphaira vitifoliae]XP_050529559.1 uncharacterized protein LOC126899066 isoform X1 [Daktulosphaira vitifoliae]XP_050529560.1 uncharacterized protein LOC126899066 isoform X1 [Daktulosphaira vitifoliae]